MMTKSGILAAPLALLLLTGTALGQTWAIFKAPPKPDPTKPLTADTAAPPTGIPGFYDSATQTFTPIESTQQAFNHFDGGFDMAVKLAFGQKLPPDKSSFLVFLFYALGADTFSSQGASYFVNSQVLSASTNFGYAGQKDVDISTSFVTRSPSFQTVVTCQSNHGNYVFLTHVYLPTQATKSGTTKLQATCNL